MSQTSNTPGPNSCDLIKQDPLLEPYAKVLKQRGDHYTAMRNKILDPKGTLKNISSGHHYFGFNRGQKNGENGIWYREWAPGATALSLVGDFNHWDTTTRPMERDQWGVWHLFLPDQNGLEQIPHASLVKVYVTSAGKNPNSSAIHRYKIPAYIKRAVQDDQLQFAGQYWNPPQEYAWKHDRPDIAHHQNSRKALRIYEAHVGMAQEKGAVGTYQEFAQNILPRVAQLGYNTVQLMAIMEHPYYASFGYHVSNFFAASSRFGTPEDLKQLIDTAHRLGLCVIMDLIHSHSVKNSEEGLNGFDGTNHQYFHAPPRGEHNAWDSLCFDYSKHEVLRFLLSNVRFWREEYHFDGFRFDGVTSMLYLDHGVNGDFNSYDDYFSSNVDWDAAGYLMLANEVAHNISWTDDCTATDNLQTEAQKKLPGNAVTKKNSHAITIAEDMSGMPGLARPTSEGGLGFDYRLAMGVPDYWIKLLKEKKDEDWNLNQLWHTLLNRRHGEKHIGYTESHDQALVGDKTIAFRLMDSHMYTAMSKNSNDMIIDRGIALHKMIRLITFSLAGQGYLNFMGNEFGHPQWIDFPRQGNYFSYQHARRQWSLVNNEDLRYSQLNEFDQAMQALDQQYGVLDDSLILQLALHEDTKQLVYQRGQLVFVFNFHPSSSYESLRIPMPQQRDYQVILNTDDKQFGGFGLVKPGAVYPWQNEPMYGQKQSVQLYLPARSAQVLVAP